ncbi:PAS domain S-box protein [bacterium]|nr:PAS domain S-box protein [bacterium]
MKLVHKFGLTFLAAGGISAAVFVLISTIRPVPILLAGLPLLASAGGYLVSALLLKPVGKLLYGLDMISTGTLNYKTGLETSDEIGQIARSVEAVADDFQRATVALDLVNQENDDFRDMQKQLSDREEYYRRLFEYSNDAVFIYEFDGNILDVNNKASEMLGYSNEEMKKISFLDLQPKTELSKSKAAVRTNPKTGSLRFETRFQRKDESVIDVEISSSIVNIKKGIMQSIVSNITERKQIERSLKESEEKFRTFMETATDLMFMMDAEARLTYVNTAMCHTLGYSREELVGMPFQEIVDRDHIEEAKARRQELIESGENVLPMTWETKLRRKIQGEMKAVAIYDNDGQFRGIRGVFRDVTERKKIEESQRLSELGKLAADVAHEVKNQIGVIATRANVSLLRNPKEKEIQEDIRIILNQCEHANGIVKRLLLFSKPSKGDFKIIDPADSALFVSKLVEKQFSQHNVQIINAIEGPLPPVRADEKQIQEVFLNLMRNAFEAMESGGTITLSAVSDGEDVEIQFTDTGSGISDADLKRIFDPFFTTKENGTGLGLSVCYGIIRAHNGDLKYTSQVGRGTTARVILPIEPMAQSG